jgi:DNA-binding Lrp family transcriptional regulator
MDELDVRILRAVISESAVAPTNIQIRSSLRMIAKTLGADDMTIASRFKKLQECGCMNEWQLSVNPALLGYKMQDVMLDVEAEYAKPDMIRKLGLIHGVIVIINFLGKAMKVTLLYNSEESRSRTIELVSRITNPELVAVSKMALPKSETEKLTGTDEVIIQALSKDARKSNAAVAKELGLSAKTVRNRLEKLRRQKSIFMFPNLNMTNITGFIPAVLSYTYSRPDAKSSVDSAVLSHFDSNFLWGGFWDTDRGSVVLSAPTMGDVPRFVGWAKSQPGVATARVDVPLQLFSFPEKLGELMRARRLELID